MQCDTFENAWNEDNTLDVYAVFGAVSLYFHNIVKIDPDETYHTKAKSWKTYSGDVLADIEGEEEIKGMDEPKELERLGIPSKTTVETFDLSTEYYTRRQYTKDSQYFLIGRSMMCTLKCLLKVGVWNEGGYQNFVDGVLGLRDINIQLLETRILEHNVWEDPFVSDGEPKEGGVEWTF